MLGLGFNVFHEVLYEMYLYKLFVFESVMQLCSILCGASFFGGRLSR